MVGIEPKQLADQMLIIGIYNGISTLSSAFTTLDRVLTRLDKLVADTPADKDETVLSITEILKRLKQWFTGVDTGVDTP
jgi:hypothetical protein